MTAHFEPIRGCPRCDGAVLTVRDADPSCFACGWAKADTQAAQAAAAEDFPPLVPGKSRRRVPIHDGVRL